MHAGLRKDMGWLCHAADLSVFLQPTMDFLAYIYEIHAIFVREV